MEKNYPYISNTKNLQEFMQRVQREIYPPQKATNDWLMSIGFKSTNDRPILKILEFLGFVDSSKQPTDTWKMDYRTSMYKRVLAKAIIQGYTELFATFQNAYAKDDNELMDFFAPRVQGGQQVLQKTVNTFKILCGIADFDSNVVPETMTQTAINTFADGSGTEVNDDGTLQVNLTPSLNVIRNSLIHKGSNSEFYKAAQTKRNTPVTISIQITLPETKDKEVYEAFFAALKSIMQ